MHGRKAKIERRIDLIRTPNQSFVIDQNSNLLMHIIHIGARSILSAMDKVNGFQTVFCKFPLRAGDVYDVVRSNSCVPCRRISNSGECPLGVEYMLTVLK